MDITLQCQPAQGESILTSIANTMKSDAKRLQDLILEHEFGSYYSTNLEIRALRPYDLPLLRDPLKPRLRPLDRLCHVFYETAGERMLFVQPQSLVCKAHD